MNFVLTPDGIFTFELLIVAAPLTDFCDNMVNAQRTQSLLSINQSDFVYM